MQWDDMDYWQSGEWQVIQEKLDDLEKAGRVYNPKRENLFAALDATPFEAVRVAILGQDPYPKSAHATGSAFSVPQGTDPLPPTAFAVAQEYQSDLGLPLPKHFNLKNWQDQGVLLWNVIPSCEAGRSLSHSDWHEWTFLTTEIVKKLSEKGIVFAFLGSRARDWVKFVDEKKNTIIVTSHPSPRGSLKSNHPFVGSRLFSRINDALCSKGMGAINWRL